MTKLLARFLVVGLGLGCTSSSAGTPMSEAPAGFWDTWGDGQAELAGYRLTIPRYGELRTGEAVLIFVTETFTHAGRVKSDGGHDDEYPVIKLNAAIDFQTGIYDYNAMTSTFVRLDGGSPLGVPTKVSLSVQEWCGHAYQQLVAGERSLQHTSHSYFDGEADQEGQLDLPEGAILADTLPIVARGLTGPLVAPGEKREVKLLPTLLDGRLAHVEPTWQAATISRSAGTAPVTVPAGTFEAYEVRVDVGDAWTLYRVEAAAPHRLLGWERATGERAELTGSFRSAYWRQQAEGDEGLRAQLGLPAPAWP